MRKEIAVERSLAKLAKLMAEAGAPATATLPPQDSFKEMAKEAMVQTVRPFMEAEAVLQFLRKPATYALKNCKRCGEPFGTDYHAVSYCGDNCRIKALESLGLRWDPTKPPERRWGSHLQALEPPNLIPPAAVRVLMQMVQKQQTSEFQERRRLSDEELDALAEQVQAFCPNEEGSAHEDLPTPLVTEQGKTSPPSQPSQPVASFQLEEVSAFGF